MNVTFKIISGDELLKAGEIKNSAEKEVIEEIRNLDLKKFNQERLGEIAIKTIRWWKKHLEEGENQ